jgi:hypothetical protein
VKYGREVIELMEAYPGRRWRMIEIVRHCAGGRQPSALEWERLRKSVRRVLEQLNASGHIAILAAQGNGASAAYCWKPGHQVIADRDANRDNSGSRSAPA